MKINKLTASFGKLENETLSLHDGLNIPCESLMSTSPVLSVRSG